MRDGLPFRYLEPTFFAGLVDDPVLWLHIRPLGRAILVDCGPIHHLAKRVLRAVDAIFITHAHMDHFMGMDTFIRHVLVSPRTVEVFGPPGIARRMECKLGSYDWNLAEDFWCSFRVHEIGRDRQRTFLLAGAEGFSCRPEAERERESALIFRNRYLRVDAALCEHKIPVLAYRITENPTFQVDKAALSGQGFIPGEWLRTLKRLYYEGRLDEPLSLQRRRGDSTEEVRRTGRQIYRAIGLQEPAASIGYVTDVGFTAENRTALRELLQGVSLLVGECSYLAQDVDRARASCHLCTDDVNSLLQDLQPRFFLPMHLSKSYIGESAPLYQQLQAPGVEILRLPERIPPRPLLPREVPFPAPAIHT